MIMHRYNQYLMAVCVCFMFVVKCKLFFYETLDITNADFNIYSAESNSSGSADVADKLKGILFSLESFTKEIEAAGARLSQTEAAEIERSPTLRMKVNEYHNDYFDLLKGFPSVSTVFFRKHFEEMRKFLTPVYYDFTSNDCYLAEPYLKRSATSGKLVFNTNCHDDINGLLVGHALEPEHFSIQSSIEFTLDPKQATWTHMNVIRNAVVTKNGDVLVTNLTLIPQRCKDNDIGELPEDPNALKEYDAVFSVHQLWETEFFHTSLEVIPRMAVYVQFLNDNPHIKIHLQNISNPLYGVLGIEKLKERQLMKPNFRAKVLYHPAGPGCGRPPIFQTQLLSLYARRLLKNSFRNKIILIKRSKTRYLNHHSEIEAMLNTEASSRGLELLVFHDDPLPSSEITMKMFNDAILIVSPHGAGESNIIYSQPGTVLVEAMCWREDKGGNLCFRNIAQILGMRYHAILFKGVCSEMTVEHIKEPVVSLLDHLDEIRNS